MPRNNSNQRVWKFNKKRRKIEINMLAKKKFFSFIILQFFTYGAIIALAGY